MTGSTFDPDPAEAARSLLVTGTTLELSTDEHGCFRALGGHVADDRGRVLVPLPEASPLAQRLRQVPDLPARLVVTDAAPVSVRDRVRGDLRLTGWLQALAPHVDDALWADLGTGTCLPPGACLVRFEPAQITLSTTGEPDAVVEPEDWAAAGPDPLAAHEADVLQHLAAGHPAELAALVGLLPARLLAGSRRVVPLRLHRRAIVLRVETDHDHTDVALALPRKRRQALPASPEQVLTGLRDLLGACCGGAS